MLNRFKKMMLSTALLSAALWTSSTASAQSLRKLVVANNSDFKIYEIYVSPQRSNYWGNDWLGRHVLVGGYQVTLSLYPGFYDVKLVDQDGDSCIIPNVDFRHSDTWSITNA